MAALTGNVDDVNERKNDRQRPGLTSSRLRRLLTGPENQFEPLAYYQLSEFEQARFNQQKRQQFDVTRKRRRLKQVSAFRELQLPLNYQVPSV